MVELGVRKIYRECYATLEKRQPSSFIMKVGDSISLPLVLHEIPFSEAQFSFINSDKNSWKSGEPLLKLAEVVVKNGQLKIKARLPGKFSLTVFVTDKLLPQLSGDPFIDNPLQLDVEIMGERTHIKH